MALMKINNSNFNSVEQIRNQYLNQKTQRKNTKKEPSFSHILDQATKGIEENKIKFSKHAKDRLSSRNINLSQDQIKRLEEARKMADQKGIKDSLVMVDDLAFIVNITKGMVITAVNEKEDRIFTNIDGAVIV